MSNPEPHPVSSPSKAVDVLDWIRIATTGLNCLCEGSPAAKRGPEVRAAVEKMVAALRFNHATLMKFAETGQPPYADLTKSIELAEAALSTIGESQ